MTEIKAILGSVLSTMRACLLLHLLYMAPALAQAGDSTGAAAPEEVVFVPPSIGAPAGRVGAATREVGGDSGMLAVLVPAGGGLTSLGKPPLVWYLAKDFTGNMTAQIAPVGRPGEGVALSGESRFRTGFYALDLTRSDLALAPGKIYEWKVALAERGAQGVMATATTYVERTDGPEAVEEDVNVLAANGLWFDALNHFVEIELSGKVRVDQGAGFSELVRSAGVTLP